MHIFDAKATADALPFDRLIAALRAMFVQDCKVPQRQVLQLGTDPADAATNVTSLIMPAWLPGRCYGVKTINIAAGNAARGLPGLHSTYVLYDATTGVPLAWLDGDQITARRTAAASALAASWLASPDASHLLLVGAGRIARLLPLAFREVRQIRRVSVWARSLSAAETLASELRTQGFDARPVVDLAAAASQCDIVSCATLSRLPLVMGRWLQPGTHLDLIGSFTPAMRESDDDCFKGARLFVDTEEALSKSGDLVGPMSRGVFAAEDLAGTLSSLCRGQSEGRHLAEERTVFKAVGTALEDLAAAMVVCGLPISLQA